MMPGVGTAYGGYQAWTGYDPIRGRDMTPGERKWAIFGTALSALPVVLGFGGDVLETATDAARQGRPLTNLAEGSTLARKVDGIVAPKGGAATFDTISEGRRLAPYYPPNRGFLGDAVDQTLQPGTRIDRYGFEGGTFASPEGVPAPMRALPPGSLDKPYNVYEVVKPLDVKSGTAAPWFQQPGLGTQYELPQSIADLIEQGVILRVD